jgi:hypothetical protein
MKPLVLVFALAAELAMTTIGVYAEDDYYYAYRNAAGYIIYEHYPTYDVYTTRDINNYPISERVHYFKDDVVPAAKPVTAATNPAHAARHIESPAATLPARTVVQAPAVVVTGSTEAEMKGASDAGAARVKAENEAEAKAKAAEDKANAKSSKRHEFKNGE